MSRATALVGACALVLSGGSTLAAQSTDSLTRPTVVPAGSPMAGAPARTDTVTVSPTEVARRAADMLGDSLVAPARKATSESVAEVTWDMDVRVYETQERVAHYVGLFSGRARDRITDRLTVGSRYEPMIRAKMKAGGVPEDMYYLALVESGFDPNAYSRAAAVGMWQFMTSTARDMGMRVDWWVDERRDPVKSTSAAVRFIRGLRDQFGSLYLAAAAYNGGPGRVARGMTKFAGDMQGAQGEDAFFVLAEKDYLKNETREYVPQLIAAALIGKEPRRYGMELRPQPPFVYDSVRVPANTPLAAVATAAGVPLAEVTELNTHLLRGMTPPKDAYQVRVPAGHAASFDSSFAALPAADLIATTSVASKKGDTADRLAHARGISVASLRSFNPTLKTLKSGRLAPGQPILLPTAAVAAAARNVPDPTIERYPGSTKHMKLHTVKKGETLGVIAKKYATTSDRIMRLNGMKKPMIFPGQSLIVSGASKAKVESKAVKAKTKPKPKARHKATARS
ncbi:MAG: transglycosylase SLT domain-containing protein [bacterium]